MKKLITIFVVIIFTSFTFTSCGGGKNESDKTSTDNSKSVSDSKSAINSISEKYYIPVDETKSSLIFTINQNLNLQFINYKGSFEGKYIDGKVQFDDSKATIIDFILNGENVILKNQNDIKVEFRLANDDDLLSCTWSYYYKYPDKNVACKMIIDSKGNWNCPRPLSPSKGKYKKQGDKKYSLPNYIDKQTGTLTLKNPNSCVVQWVDFLTEETRSHVLTRYQNGKLESLNQIFN